MKRETMEMGGRRGTTRARGRRQNQPTRSTTNRARGSKGSGKGAKMSARGGTSRSRSQSRGTSGTRGAGSAKSTTNLNEIRRWAEARGGTPVSVRGTARGGAAGLLRIDFPGYSGAGKFDEISWDEWYQKFRESNLEFLYQDRASGGGQSRFFKLVARGSGKGTSKRGSTGRSQRGRSAGNRSRAASSRGMKPRAQSRSRARTHR